mmetsp:Transcript_18177/g.42082  ORF Transcript_18177/g.42082 Transcript_18177/m.42082 type:complete len:194 (-) Transcript_18177:128-709(-)
MTVLEANPEIEPRNRVETSLKRWAPQNSPLLWVIVNANLLGYSLFLLLATWDGFHNPNVALFAKRSYLIYNFISCFAWCLQVGLNEWNSRTGDRKNIWSLRAELSLAIAIWTLTMISLYNWRIRHRPLKPVLEIVILCVVAFGYATVASTLYLMQYQSEDCRIESPNGEEENKEADEEDVKKAKTPEEAQSLV